MAIEHGNLRARDRLCGSADQLAGFGRALRSAQKKSWRGNSVELTGSENPFRLDPSFATDGRCGGDANWPYGTRPKRLDFFFVHAGDVDKDKLDGSFEVSLCYATEINGLH